MDTYPQARSMPSQSTIGVFNDGHRVSQCPAYYGMNRIDRIIQSMNSQLSIAYGYIRIDLYSNISKC